jgi:hypothetical protein
MSKTKIAHITLLDQYHPGIYDSQVLDVCRHLEAHHEVQIQLIAFLSIRELRHTSAKKTIKSKYPNTWVLPAFPKLRYFRLTQYLLALVLLFNKQHALICRNVFATQIGLFCRKWGLVKKVVFDGRSAIAAEIEEYDVFPVPYLRNQIKNFEQSSVMESDYQMGISQALVDYWQQNYGYQRKVYSIVPCTLHSQFKWTYADISDEKEVTVVYAGSNAPWQGFAEIDEFLIAHPNVKCTLLTKESKETGLMQAKFGDRLNIKWVNSQDVCVELAKHDYGLLLRPQTMTNQVASPGKFAEYLSCGLPVILTPRLGDYSAWVVQHKCGLVWDKSSSLELKKSGQEVKKHCHELAMVHFVKNAPDVQIQYQKLVNAIHGE